MATVDVSGLAILAVESHLGIVAEGTRLEQFAYCAHCFRAAERAFLNSFVGRVRLQFFEELAILRSFDALVAALVSIIFSGDTALPTDVVKGSMGLHTVVALLILDLRRKR